MVGKLQKSKAQLVVVVVVVLLCAEYRDRITGVFLGSSRHEIIGSVEKKKLHTVRSACAAARDSVTPSYVR